MRPQTERRLAPLTVAAVVLVVIAVVWAVLRVLTPAGQPLAAGSSPSGGPAPLRLVGWSAPRGEVADPRYHLAPGADLTRRPGSAPVRRLAAADVPAAAESTGAAVSLDRSRDGAESGWLRRSTPGPAYPLVSAVTAYAALVHRPLPMTLVACPEPLPEGADPVTCGGPVTVTGARLGLSVQQDRHGPLLVPSWLFEVAGSPRPLVVVAVRPSLVRGTPPAMSAHRVVQLYAPPGGLR